MSQFYTQESLSPPASPMLPKSKKSAKRSRPTPVVAVVKRRAKRLNIPKCVSMGRQAFPKQMCMTHKYVKIASPALNSSGQYEWQFAANGMNLCDITGVTGAQPLYFDQMGGIYNLYVVLRSRIKATMCNFTYNGPCLLLINADDDTTSGTSASTLLAMERPGCRWTNFNPNSTANKSVYHSYDAKKMYGGTYDSIMANNSLNGLGTGAVNPSQLSYYHVRFDGWTAATNASVATATIEIEYDVVLD